MAHSLNLNAQVIDLNYQNNRDVRNEYVKNLNGLLNVSPFIYAASNRFVFAGGGKKIDYSPNEAPSIGIKLQHKWLGVSFMWGPKNIQEEKKGTSTYYSFNLNSYGKTNGFDIYYTTNKGYYVDNKKVLQDLGINAPAIIRSDLHTIGAGLNAYYIFNHKKYSYRSTFIQNEIQKKSAGSFLTTVSCSYYSMGADSSVVLNIYHREVSRESQIMSGTFYSAGLMPGYAHTFVILKKFYATISISWGPLFQIQNYTIKDSIIEQDISRKIWITRGLIRAGIGYNSEKFYAGFSGVGDNYHIPLGTGNQLQYSVGNVQLFLGFRFVMPKKARFVSDWMDKVPLLSEKSE